MLFDRPRQNQIPNLIGSDNEDENTNSDDEDVEPPALSSAGRNDNNTESGLNPNDLTGTKEINANEYKSSTGFADVQSEQETQDQEESITIEDSNDYNDDWLIDLETNGFEVHYKIDTGAQANVLPLSEQGL